MRVSRRRPLAAVPAGFGGLPAAGAAEIDWKAVVERHNPVLFGFDPRLPLSVGNGEFAFTAEATEAVAYRASAHLAAAASHRAGRAVLSRAPLA
jgi:hypothetical protein